MQFRMHNVYSIVFPLPMSSDVNNDLTFKDQDKDKDFSSKDKDKDCIVKDKDQDKDCIFVLKESLRTRTNITGYKPTYTS